MKITLTTNDGVVLGQYDDVELGSKLEDVQNDIDTMKKHPGNFESYGLFIGPGPFGEVIELNADGKYSESMKKVFEEER